MAVRTAAARTIDGLIRRLDLKRSVFIEQEEENADFHNILVNVNLAKEQT